MATRTPHEIAIDIVDCAARARAAGDLPSAAAWKRDMAEIEARRAELYEELRDTLPSMTDAWIMLAVATAAHAARRDAQEWQESWESWESWERMHGE